MIQTLTAIGVGLGCGALYGLLFIRHTHAITSQQTAAPIIVYSLLRLGIFAGVITIILRYWPNHFILGILAFVSAWWLVVWCYTRRRSCKDPS